MPRRIRPLFALAVLFASFVAVELPASAEGAPETLAATARLSAAPVEVAFPIDHLGVQWEGEAAGAGAVRFRHGTTWSAWQPLVADDLEVEGRFASALIAAGDASAYQVRVPGGAAAARAVALNTTDGPRQRTRRLGTLAGAATPVVSRAAWGADESLRTWAPAYYPVQKLTVHHTATANGDADPAATVRAIYRYHAVDRQFGDLGYQYLIDEAGRVYEGRWSGTDGDAGHDAGGQGVTGAHVGGWNSGNLGVALLGTLTSQAPAPAARSSLESVLTDLAGRHGLDPQATSTFVNPVNGATKVVPNISGHRDWEATECPGSVLAEALPSIRQAVAERLAAPEAGTTTTTTSSTTTTSTTSPTTTTATKKAGPGKPRR